jgi:hypothetical protein
MFDFSLVDDAVMGVLGAPVLHRRGSTDTIVTAVEADPYPEDGISGQFIVRMLRPEDLPGGIAEGDTMILDPAMTGFAGGFGIISFGGGLDGVEYDVFAVRQRENSTLARVYLSKA